MKRALGSLVLLIGVLAVPAAAAAELDGPSKAESATAIDSPDRIVPHLADNAVLLWAWAGCGAAGAGAAGGAFAVSRRRIARSGGPL